MRPMSTCAIAFEPELGDDHVDWPALLAPWLRVFSSGSAAFANVEDWHPDGSRFTRHGVLVDLRVAVTKALAADRAAHIQKIREAIDLVQLALAVKPSVIKPALLRGVAAVDGNRTQPMKYAEELAALARGVPVELRLTFAFSDFQSSLLKTRFLDTLMQHGDRTLSRHPAFLPLRQQLLRRLFQRPVALARVAHCAKHSSVRTQLVIDSSKNVAVSEEDSERYVVDLAAFVRGLDQYQRREGRHAWSIMDRHAVVCVEKIVLLLRRMHVTPTVVESAKSLMSAGIPVTVTHVNLDFRFVSCTEEDLTSFVQAITTGATDLIVDTGSLYEETEDEKAAADAGGQDCVDRIRMMTKAIGGIRSMRCLNMAGILRLCTTVGNRAAVWRGLFEDVLSRDDALELLTFDSEVDLTEEDGACIRECVAQWHAAFPGKTLEVSSLELYLVVNADNGGISGILSAFDDLKKLTLCLDEPRESFPPPLMASCLRYPSLRSLKLGNISITTMDMFDPSISDPLITNKPVLQELHLDDIQLEDIPSMSRFLHQLKQPAPATNELATSLHVLRITQDSNNLDEVPIFDRTSVAQVDEMLETNRSLAVVSISVDYNDKEHTLPLMKGLIAKHNDRAMPTVDDTQQSVLVKACNRAFLSTISPRITRDNDVGTRARLYSSLSSQIFEFTAPHKKRKIGFNFVNL